MITPDTPAPPLEDTIERAMPAVVMVETSTIRGSGFFAAPDLIVTNAHVLAGASSASIKRRETATVSKARLVLVSEPLAISHFSRSRNKECMLDVLRPAARTIGNACLPGQSVMVALGMGAEYDAKHGHTRRRHGTAARRRAAAAADRRGGLNHGDSGGPLLDLRGNVIG